MRAAPPVDVVAALRGAWWFGAWGLWGFSAATFIAWLSWHGRTSGLGASWILLPQAWAVGALALGSLVGAATTMVIERRRVTRLTCTGGVWSCEPCAAASKNLVTEVLASPRSGAGAPGRVDVMLDLGNAMLLRWRSSGAVTETMRPVWLPLSRRGQEAGWHGLRVALNLASAQASGVAA